MKSEIRQSTINKLKEKAQKTNYGKYLKKVHINKLRAFVDQTIEFDFPVTALIGPNGGGKTTVLSSCALLYKSVQPRSFFTKSPQFDQEMKDWSISYESIDRSISKSDIVRRTASFSQARWSRDALEREVLFFGVSRTLPAVERRDLLNFTHRNATYDDKQIFKLTEQAAICISRILGKDVSRYKVVANHINGSVTLFTGENCDGEKFSEFHFGAGESSVIKMVNAIETASQNALILIEEIENGLHPVATTRLIEYLVNAADKKALQVIFTTHSEHAVSCLPSEAVWAALDGKLQQGKLDIMSLRMLTGDVGEQLAIFVEDEFAKRWVGGILRTDEKIAIDAIEIYVMGGDGTAVTVHRNRQKDPSSKIPSICIIDGDSSQLDDSANGVFRLFGEAPETYIFDSVNDTLELAIALLTVRLGKRVEHQDNVKKHIQEIDISNMDHHLLFVQLGAKLGYLSESVVIEAYISTWCEKYVQEVEEFLAKLDKYLPKQ